MADFEDMTLRLLREIRDDVSVVKRDVRGLKGRVATLEEQVRYVITSLGGMDRRIDRLEERNDRIEKRLDLQDRSLAEAQAEFEVSDQ